MPPMRIAPTSATKRVLRAVVATSVNQSRLSAEAPCTRTSSSSAMRAATTIVTATSQAARSPKPAAIRLDLLRPAAIESVAATDQMPTPIAPASSAAETVRASIRTRQPRPPQPPLDRPLARRQSASAPTAPTRTEASTSLRPKVSSTTSQRAVAAIAAITVSGTRIAASHHEAASIREFATETAARREAITFPSSTAPAVAPPASTASAWVASCETTRPTSAPSTPATRTIQRQRRGGSRPGWPAKSSSSARWLASRPTVIVCRPRPKRLVKKGSRPLGKREMSDHRISTRSISSRPRRSAWRSAR